VQSKQFSATSNPLSRHLFIFRVIVVMFQMLCQLVFAILDFSHCPHKKFFNLFGYFLACFI
jgi:ABC-type sugar transport system permease subunit